MKRVRRRVFQAWFRFSRPMTLGVRAAVLRDDGKVLLVRHTYTDGLYLPGGGVEKGETAEAALIKELQEEGGVDLQTSPDVFAVYANFRYFPGDHVLFYKIAPDAWSPCPPASRGEISERVWVHPSDTPADTTDATKRRLSELFHGKPKDPLW